MSVKKVTYKNKIINNGQTANGQFLAVDANMLKDVVNHNAEEIDNAIVRANLQYKGSINLYSPVPENGNYFWSATEAGIYTNFGGLEVPEQSLAVISRINGAWSISATEIKTPQNKINDWDLKDYSTGEQVIYEGQLWQAIQDATESDIPNEDSPVWKLVLSGIKGKGIDDGYVEDGRLYLTNEGEVVVSVELPAGGGGSGSGGINFKVRTLTPSNFSVTFGSDAFLSFNWTSIDQEDESSTGSGSLVINVNGRTVLSSSVFQGDNTVNIGSHLIAGNNSVTVRVSDSYGNARSLSYQVNAVSLSISSSYDASTVNTGDITFRYIPVGAINKTINFELNGVPLSPVETTLTNRQMTYVIPAQSHGTHTLKVYMTAFVDGAETRSNELNYDLMSVESGRTETLIASTMAKANVQQFTTLSIPYAVYNPLATTANVDLKVDGVVLSSLRVNRSLQTWNYKITKSGIVNLSIESNGVVKNILLNVTASELDVEAESADLRLFLTSQNRSNQETKRDEWKYNAISATLTDFNFATNGWVSDQFGSTVLKVSDTARVSVPLRIFETDFKNVGKTLEFEFMVTEMTTDTASIISCIDGNVGFNITGQTASFRSEQTNITTHFKENERVRISFVITKNSEDRLLQIYINGILSGVSQYPNSDSFLQNAPKNISIGSSECSVLLYNIRVYDNNLNQYQILDNFIADMDDLEKKLYIYENNDIYDGNGKISIDKTLAYLPALIIEGSLPTFKGDKKTAKAYYTNLQDPSKSFTSNVATVDVQGTSSQYYPRKNFKIKFADFTTQTGTSSKYQLRPTSVPEGTYTFKADFAESSGTHNTGLARVIQDSLVQLGYETPPMKTDVRVRTTIDGFPILIYHREKAGDELEFVGKYNFNNDKTDATFGFTGNDIECWETLNNTSSNILFTDVDFDSVDVNGEPNWLNDYEARYPEDHTDNTKLKRLAEWVESTKGNPTKFKAEAGEYFNLEYLLFYYVTTELFAMVDQRGKNMFLTFFPENGKNMCYPIFYDNDTILGINNEGAIAFGYDVEYHDSIGSGNVWNAESSVLWNNVELAFDAEIEALYKTLRTEGIYTYEKLIQYLNVEQSEKWSESIYNEDSKFKYIDPLLEDGNGSYLYAAQGSRVEHRKWWLFNRFKYMDSKYNTSGFLTDYATMRLYTPTTWSGVPPNADFQLTAYQDGYSRIKYGSYNVRARLKKDTASVIKSPDIVFNDTETIVYGASLIKSLGSLASKYVGTLDVSRAVNLTELIVGSNISGYVNTNLTHLTLGNNTLLTKINVGGCTRLNTALDLSGCTNIKEIEAINSGITGVVLPEGGSITKLQLPAISSLILKNQIALTQNNLTIANYNNLTTLVLENCPNLNSYTLLNNSTKANRIRLTGLNGNTANADAFYKVSLAKGLDTNGNTIQHSYLEGNWTFGVMYQDDFDYFRNIWPDFNITASSTTNILEFKDQFYRNALIAKFDTNGDGKLSLQEVRAVTDLDGVLGSVNGNVDEFNEFRFFNSVTSIKKGDLPDYSQNYNLMLKSVTFPQSLITIADNTNFYSEGILNYEQLRYIGDNGCAVGTSIEDYSSSFRNTPLLTLPNLQYLGTGAFRGASGITSVDLRGSSITEIKEYTFYNCMSLSHIKLNEGIKTISERAFHMNRSGSGLTPAELVIPDSVETIGKHAFRNFCNHIVSLKLGSGVKVIESYAFYRINTSFPAANLFKNVVIPASVEYIGEAAFGGFEAAKYKDFIMEGTIPPSIEYDIWSFRAGADNIYVPDSAVTAYKTATNWSRFASIIKPISQRPIT